jgi:hypothetical protein
MNKNFLNLNKRIMIIRFEFCLPTCKQELGTPAIGQTVAVPIPTFDGGKGDSRNLLGIIIAVFNLTILF